LILQYFNHNIICKLSKLLNNTVVGLDELRRFSDEKFEIDNNLIDFYSCQDSTFLKRIFFLNFIYDLNWIVK